MLRFEVHTDLGPLERQFGDAALRAAQMQLTEAVASAFKEGNGYVPVRTGSLRDSGHVADAAAGTVEWTMPYAGYVFHGTTRQAAQNWLLRALQAGEAVRWEKTVAEALNGGAL